MQANQVAIRATISRSCRNAPTRRYDARWNPQTAARNSTKEESSAQDSDTNQVTGPIGFSPATPWKNAVSRDITPTMMTKGEKNWANESFG